MLRGLIGDLRSLAQLGNALRELDAGARDARRVRNDRAAGVIELVEVAPGVYAPPKGRKVPRAVRQTITDVRELGEVLGEVERAWKR